MWRSGRMHIAQLIADTFCSWLVALSQHLFNVTIGCENKNDLEVDSRSKIPGAFADSIAQPRRGDFGEFLVVSLSLFGFPKTLCLGQRFCKRAVVLRAIRRKFRVLRSQRWQSQDGTTDKYNKDVLSH